MMFSNGRCSQRRKGLIIFPAVFSCFLFLFFSAAPAHAKDEPSAFYKDYAVDIYYEVGQSEVDQLQNVKITRKVYEGNFTFLAVEGNGPGASGKEGYILLDRIRAILPTGYLSPRRNVGTT